MSGSPRPERDYDLTGLEQRLRALNPGYSAIHVDPPTGPNAAVRVIVTTTREELAKTGGALRLTDPDLEGVQIEATLRFLDQKPGERLRVELRREPP
jgi:hypothetical protein